MGSTWRLSSEPQLRGGEAFRMGPPHEAPTGIATGVADFLFQPTPFPTQTPSLKAAMDAYYAAQLVLCNKLLVIFAAAIGVRPDFFTSKSRHHASSLRAIHYPTQHFL